MLALSPVTEGAAQVLIYGNHPDSGWAEEYWVSMWSAYLYLMRNQAAWSEAELVVVGKNQGIMKDCLLLALYEVFLSCTVEEMMRSDFDPKQVGLRAIGIEKMIKNRQENL